MSISGRFMIGAAVAAISGGAFGQQYTITEFGAGSGFDAVYPSGISANGKITGAVQIPVTGEIHAFVWDQGVFHDLGMMGYTDGAEGIAINNAGQIAALGYGPGWHAVRYTSGVVRRLGSIDGGNSSPAAINSAGHVVGRAVNGDGGGQGFVYVTSMTALAVDVARGINDSDQIVGSYTYCWGLGQYLSCAEHGFLRTGTTIVDIGNIGGGFGGYTEAYAINNAGQVTGYSTGVGGVQHAFRYTAGQMTDLGTFAPYRSVGVSITSRGDVAGNIQTYGGTTITGFVTINDVMYDLAYLLGPRGVEWSQLEITQMNDAGWIIGSGMMMDGTYHAFLATPFTCTADFNGDSSVDFFDYLDFVNAFSTGDVRADFNHDGAIDFFDYLDFVDAFSVGC